MCVFKLRLDWLCFFSDFIIINIYSLSFFSVCLCVLLKNIMHWCKSVCVCMCAFEMSQNIHFNCVYRMGVCLYVCMLCMLVI